MKVLVPDGVEVAPVVDAVSDLPGVEVIAYDAMSAVPDKHRDAEVYVIWDRSSDLVLADVTVMPQVRLVQGLMAGVDHRLIDQLPPGVELCSGVGLHSMTVAEHTLALLLALVRRLPAMARAQADHVWSRDLGGSQPLHPQGQITTLIDAHIVIWGFGSIAQHLAPVLRALGARVTGVARHPGERAGVPVVTDDDLDALLPTADTLIMILPASPETTQALDARRIGLLSPDALVINVGRGTTIDTDALADALDAGRLAGAALDVTPVEPLPASSRLWNTKNLLITPHAAGGRPVGYADLIARNVQHLLDGSPLDNPAR